FFFMPVALPRSRGGAEGSRGLRVRGDRRSRRFYPARSLAGSPASCHAPPLPMSQQPRRDARAQDDADVHCQDVARRHYENFPTASFILPASVRPAIAAIYAFARAADDFADEPEHEGRRTELISAWRTRLEEAAAGRPEG